MTFNQQDVFSLSPMQVSTSLGDEAVILNFDQGQYYSLNEVGAMVWNKLTEAPQTKAMLTASILDAYDVEEQTCSADLDELLTNLLHAGLVEKN